MHCPHTARNIAAVFWSGASRVPRPSASGGWALSKACNEAACGTEGGSTNT